MAFSPALALLTFVACAIVLASFWSWLIATVKAAITWNWLPPSLATRAEGALQAAGLSPRLPLIAWSDRRPVPWALIDLIGLVGLWLFASLAVSTIAHGLGWIESGSGLEDLSLEQRKGFLLANIAISLLVAGGGLAIIALRARATFRDLGWSWKEAAADLRTGLVGFVMLAPPTYALQGLLVWLWKPSKHPLMEMFKGTPDIGFFAFLFVSAAIVAPLFEEFMFRVILQGFLEKVFSFSGDVNELVFGAMAPRTIELTHIGLPLADVPAIENNCVVAPKILQPQLRVSASWLPIGISSAIFALLHYSHGPDWIPLLFLAAGLGYLYQRTHRLLPSLIVHAALNSLSLWGLWVQVHEGLGTP